MRTYQRSLLRLALVPALALSVVACGDDDDPMMPEPAEDIVEIASTTPQVSTLVTALQSANLVSALQGPGPFTVFAPVNDAFAALPAGELDRLLQPGNIAELQNILQLHVVSGSITSADLSEGQTVTALNGGTLTVSLQGGASVNGASIIQADIEASNGYIHLIDEVILPPVPTIAEAAAASADLSTLVAALDAADLVGALNGDGPFTVFAPVNAAFDALGADVVAALLEEGNLDLLTKILTFHVVPGAAVESGDLTDGQMVTTLQGEQLTIGVSGGGVTVNGATVTTADVQASNGIVHIIDGVLTPEVDIVEKAILTAQTQTLVSAVAAGGLVETLKGDGPFTVFAPIDDAFAALGTDRLEVLLAPENQALLQKVLTYHVIAGDIRAADLTDGAMVETVQGSNVTIDLSGDMPMVNGANIIATDIAVGNGVIHLIDGVLTENLDIVDVATVNGFSTLGAALGAADLVGALQGDGPFTVFAPTNAAFDALGADVVGALLQEGNIALLSKILTFHVVPGAAVLSGDLTDGQTVTTLQGEQLTIGVSDDGVTVDGANVVAADVGASNGVIHVIDGVLTPEVDIVEKAILTAQTQTLVSAVAAGGLVETLKGDGPFTVFAPINEAFAALGTDKLDVLLAPENQALLQKVLTYHVIAGDIRAADLTDGAMVETVQGSNVTIDLSGDTPMVNGANIVATDIAVGNGVIHLIDGVLTENLDIVDVATVNGFSALTSLVEQQGLTETLRTDNAGDGFTVFAPTDAAFGALASVPEGQALTDVLLYHVVGATVPSSALTDGQVVTTLQTGTFTVNIGDSVTITDGAGNTVNVVVTDVQAANGVIHVVDAVLLPGS